MPPLSPPVAPMLATLVRELPRGAYLYEPKWDGFRGMAFVDHGQVDLRSRHGRPFARYFPELVEALAAIAAPRFVIDGEIVIEDARGCDFAALMMRTHPASSRVAKLARETPATFIAFDVLEIGGEDLTARPFGERRARLLELLARAPPRIRATEATADPEVARHWLEALRGLGIDGVVAKPLDLRYAPGKRAMIKVKLEHTVDCVVAGVRVFDDGSGVASILLGLYDGGVLRHVGVCSQFTARRRRELAVELQPRVAPLEGHPWEHGFELGPSPMGRLPGSAGRWVPGEMERDWIPLRPELVCEVAYDHLDGARFRHPARFVRWRPDREPRSCSIEQLA